MDTTTATLPDPELVPLLNVDDAVPFLRVSRGAVYAAIARGDLPAIRIGKRVLIPTAALRRLLELGAG